MQAVASLTLHVALARDHMGGWRARVLVSPRQVAGAELGSDDWDEFHLFIVDLHFGTLTVAMENIGTCKRKNNL